LSLLTTVQATTYTTTPPTPAYASKEVAIAWPLR
jgi:hypothetical protein